jgi:hypothetical protein
MEPRVLSEIYDEATDCDHRNQTHKTDAWEVEYALQRANPGLLRTVSIYFSVISIMNVVRNAFFAEAEVREQNGESTAWIVYSSISLILCGLWNVIMYIFASCERTRNICVRMYSALCIGTLSFAYSGAVLAQIIIEIRRAKFQRIGYENVHLSINFDHFLPERACNDTDPVKTWRDVDNLLGFTKGCENRLLCPIACGYYLMITLCPILLEMDKMASLVLVFIHLAVLLIGTLSIGVNYKVMLTAATFQLLVGLIAQRICAYQEEYSKKRFFLSQATRNACERNHELLKTLMPENILQKLGPNPSVEMHGAVIPHCTVMFCMLKNAAELQDAFSEEVFQMLNRMFSEFDDAVRRRGMYKYQHGEGPHRATASPAM